MQTPRKAGIFTRRGGLACQVLRSGRGRLILGLGMLAVLSLAAGIAYGRSKTVYVTVRRAKMREGPGAGQAKAVCFAPYGEPLEVLEENERYYKVKWGVAVGWVHKSQVGDRRPRKEVTGRSGSGLSKLTGSQASAAATHRRINEGKKYAAAKNLNAEYKLVEWMETLIPTQEALDRFMEEGRIGHYQDEE